MKININDLDPEIKLGIKQLSVEINKRFADKSEQRKLREFLHSIRMGTVERFLAYIMTKLDFEKLNQLEDEPTPFEMESLMYDIMGKIQFNEKYSDYAHIPITAQKFIRVFLKTIVNLAEIKQEEIVIISTKLKTLVEGIAFNEGEDVKEMQDVFGSDLFSSEKLLMLETKNRASNRYNYEIFIDEIDSFEKVKTISFDSISPYLKDNYLNISEVQIKNSFAKIINEEFSTKDWGGEYNDLYTSQVFYNGKRIRTAFLFKGSGTKSKQLRLKDCGKNGDQIVRLFETPAELYFIQFVGGISEAVIKDVRSKIELLNMKGTEVKFCILNGSETARILVAYELMS